MAVERVIWVYAVAPVVRREWFGQGDGVGRRPVWGISIAGLAAAVSGVNAAEYGLEAIEALLRRIDDDLEGRAWIRQLARRHHTVIEKIAEHQPVVPMRLATLCADEAEVISQLTERRDELQTFVDAHPGQHVRYVGEPIPPASRTRVRAAVPRAARSR